MHAIFGMFLDMSSHRCCFHHKPENLVTLGHRGLRPHSATKWMAGTTSAASAMLQYATHFLDFLGDPATTGVASTGFDALQALMITRRFRVPLAREQSPLVKDNWVHTFASVQRQTLLWEKEMALHCQQLDPQIHIMFLHLQRDTLLYTTEFMDGIMSATSLRILQSRIFHLEPSEASMLSRFKLTLFRT